MDANPIDVQKHLKGVSYPASRDDLVDAARENGADEKVVRQLENASDERFESPADVMQALG